MGGWVSLGQGGAGGGARDQEPSPPRPHQILRPPWPLCSGEGAGSSSRRMFADTGHCICLVHDLCLLCTPGSPKTPCPPPPHPQPHPHLIDGPGLGHLLTLLFQVALVNSSPKSCQVAPEEKCVDASCIVGGLAQHLHSPHGRAEGRPSLAVV